MVIALPIWRERISPVLDKATRLLVVRTDDAGEDRSEVVFESPFSAVRAAQLAGLGVDVLICGALSRPFEIMLQASGITVCSWVSGGVDEVIEAYKTGCLREKRFALPGGERPGNRWRHRGGSAMTPSSDFGPRRHRGARQ